METIDLLSHDFGPQLRTPNQISTSPSEPFVSVDPFSEHMALPGQVDYDFAMTDLDQEKPKITWSQLQQERYPRYAGDIPPNSNSSSWLSEGLSLPDRAREQQEDPAKPDSSSSRPSFQLSSSFQPTRRKRPQEIDPTETSAPVFRLPSTFKPTSNNSNSPFETDFGATDTQPPAAKKKRSKHRDTQAPTTTHTTVLPRTPTASSDTWAPAYPQHSGPTHSAPQYVDVSTIDNITNMAQSLTQMLNGQACVTSLVRDLATRVNEQDQTIRTMNRELNALRQHMDATFKDFAEQTTKANRALEEKCQEVIDSRDDDDVLRGLRVPGGAYGGPKFQAPVQQPSVFKTMMPDGWNSNGAQR